MYLTPVLSTRNPFKLIRIDYPRQPCFRHKLHLFQFQLPCGHGLCIMCLHEMRASYYNNRVVSHCGNGEYLQIHHIEECIRQCEHQEEPVRHEWSRTDDNIFCSQHCHSKVCLNLSCGRALCLKCIQSIRKTLNRPSKGEKRTNVKCICGIFIHSSEITMWLEVLLKTVTDGPIIQRFYQEKRCNHHKTYAMCAKLPCGVLLCHRCIVGLLKEAVWRHNHEPIRQKQPFQAFCPGCNDTIPGELLELFLKEGLPVFRRHDTNCWCKYHPHHKIVMKNDANIPLCKMCFEAKVHSDVLLDEKRYSVKDAAKQFRDTSLEELFCPPKCEVACTCRTLKAQAILPCGLHVCYHCVYEMEQKHCKKNEIRCPKCDDVLSTQHLQTFLEKYDKSECYLISIRNYEQNCLDHRHWKVFCESNTLIRRKLCPICIWQNKKFPMLPTNVVQHFLEKIKLKWVIDKYNKPLNQ